MLLTVSLNPLGSFSVYNYCGEGIYNPNEGYNPKLCQFEEEHRLPALFISKYVQSPDGLIDGQSPFG